MRRAYMYMRKKNLAGSYFGKHAGINGLSKSVGEFIDRTNGPTVPTGVNITNEASTSLTVNWSASTDNVGVTGYKVFRDAVQIADLNALTYNDSGLTPSTAYTYTVLAYDANGNESAQSAGVIGTTTA